MNSFQLAITRAKRTTWISAIMRAKYISKHVFEGRITKSLIESSLEIFEQV